MTLAWLKTLHLLSLVFWIGPGFGAYWILFRLEKSLPDANRRTLEKFYEQVIRVEHFFFGMVLASGLGMLATVGWEWALLPWLKLKLCLVAAVALIEAADIGLAHFLFRRLILSQEPMQGERWRRALRLRNLFYGVTLPLMAGLVLGIFAIAVKASLYR